MSRFAHVAWVASDWHDKLGKHSSTPKACSGIQRNLSVFKVYHFPKTACTRTKKLCAMLIQYCGCVKKLVCIAVIRFWGLKTKDP